MLIKKVFIVVLILVFFTFSVDSLDENDISARSAVVIDVETGTVLYNKNMSDQRSMASTTKIMTAILAIESGRLGCTVTADKDISSEGTSIGIEKGDCCTLETLVWAVLLESGNDAAVLIAEYLAGTESDFAVIMNSKAAEIGMENTNFVTASGLDADEHYSTAYDMAVLASYAIKNPIFRRICSSEQYIASYIVPETTETYTNHNKLLKMYDGVFGVKTGFTKKSGRCLVSACERNGTTLIIVTLNAPDDWNDHIKLYGYCFGLSDQSNIDIALPERLRIYGAECEWLDITCDDISVSTINNDSVSYSVLLPQFAYAPISEGDCIGKVILLVDGKKYKEIALKADMDIASAEGDSYLNYTLIYKLKNIFNYRMKG